MKLWLLEYISGSPKFRQLWECNLGLVVRAHNETNARLLAASVAESEGSDAWLSAQHTTCEEITTEGDPSVILTSYQNA